MKSSQRFLGSKDGSKFWWLPWFPVNEVLGQHLCTGLYVVLKFRDWPKAEEIWKTEAIDQRWKQLAIYLVLQMSLKIFFLLVEKNTNNFWYFDLILMSYLIAFLIPKLPAPWKLTFLQIWWIYNYCSASTDCEKCCFGHFMQKKGKIISKSGAHKNWQEDYSKDCSKNRPELYSRVLWPWLSLLLGGLFLMLENN